MSVIVGFSIAQQAAASTAADARIQNRVTVTYTGGSDFFDLYVTVTLVSADATVSAPSPATPSIASNGTVDIAFTVTSSRSWFPRKIVHSFIGLAMTVASTLK